MEPYIEEDWNWVNANTNGRKLRFNYYDELESFFEYNFEKWKREKKKKRKKENKSDWTCFVCLGLIQRIEK